MARILGIDYGRKRTGVAATDPMGIVASPLAAVPTHQLEKFILDYVANEQVSTIVVGEPRQLDGTPSESMRYIEPFVRRLRRLLPEGITVVMSDERFTSTIAHRAMIDGGMKKSDRRDKNRVDPLAATIILNDYLNAMQMQGGNADIKTEPEP